MYARQMLLGVTVVPVSNTNVKVGITSGGDELLAEIAAVAGAQPNDYAIMKTPGWLVGSELIDIYISGVDADNGDEVVLRLN